MKILHICPRFEPAHGGAEDYITTIAKWTAQNPENDVTVWTTDALEVDALWFPGKQKVEVLEEDIDGVHVKRFKTTPLFMNNLFINKSIRWLLVHSPIPFLRILGTPPTCFDMWMQIFRKDLPKFDVVHVDCMPYYSLLYIARAVARKVGAKLLFTPFTHLGTDKNDPLRKKYFDTVGIQFYLDADKIFIQTETEKNAIVNFVKENGKEISDEKFEKVGLGIFPEKINIGKGEVFRKKYSITQPVVCTMGAKNFVKGTFTLVKAMEILWKEGMDIKLGLAGNTSMEFENFWKLQSDLVFKNTINLDIPNDQDKLNMLDASDVFVMISKSESFGIVYLEAWYYKKPVIAADIEIMKEIVNIGEDGLVSEFDNPEVLAKNIKELLQNKELREKFGNNGYNKVISSYTWEKKFKILEKYFNA